MKRIITSALILSLVLMFISCGYAHDSGYTEAPGGQTNYSAVLVEESPRDYSVGYSSPDYGKIIENAFIKTADENVSTFSADVDTASYSYMRKLVSLGFSFDELCKSYGASVRTEEMINYFTYDYPAPRENELFGIKADMAKCPWDSGSVVLRLGLRAEDAVKSSGNNFVFLIDVSGSMASDDKLPLLKKAFTYLTENLTGSDIVSIVTYAGGEKVVLEGCEGTDKDKILSAVNSLGASGSTNGEAGLKKAYDIAKRHYITGGNNRIIMASDGDLNVGISSAEELKAFVSEKRGEGVYLSVLGFGTGNFRDANMEAIADNGNGVYYYIDGEREASKVFGTDLTSTLYTVAEDVKLQLTFEPTLVSEYRLVGYENRLLPKEDFEDDTKDAGEVGAGHRVTVCYELRLAEGALGSALPLAHLAIRYKEPGESESKLNEYDIGAGDYTETPSDEFRFICAVAETAMMLHKSESLPDQTDIFTVINTLAQLDLAGDADKTEFAALLRKAANGG